MIKLLNINIPLLQEETEKLNAKIQEIETIKSQVDVDQTDHSQDKERSTKPTHVKPRELYFKQDPDKNTTLVKSRLLSNQVTAREKHFN